VTGDAIGQMMRGSELGKKTMMSACSEITESFFAEDITKHRCVIPEDEYFEWSLSKQPLIFKANSSDIMFLAGFYNRRKEFVVLTRRAVGKLSAIHHRIPIMLTDAQLAEWHSPQCTASCRPIQRI
jgi:putative SOS response-associated peptidase YedK